MTGQQKVPFTNEEDALLMKYIATYNPKTRGRLGVKLYERLVENAERRWSFASRHSVQSWRERYKMNQQSFDAKILRYQKKHGISPDSSPLSSQATTSAGDIPAFSSLTGNSPPLTKENGSKKRTRGLNALSVDPGSIKKMRRADGTPQRSRTYHLPSHSVLPLEEPKIIGSDEYIGALSGKGCQGVETQSDGDQSSRSSRPFPSSILIKRTRSKPSGEMKNPGRVATAPGESPQSLASSPREEGPHYHCSQSSASTSCPPSQLPAPKALGSVHKPVITPLQLSQEPTPPHTSALSSPGAPLSHGQSHTFGVSSQSGTKHVASVKESRTPSIKCSIMQGEEDDIFRTPPMQSLPSSPPPRTRVRAAPRLVEGPYRSAYSRANDSHWPALHDPLASGIDKEGETNADQWPPRRSKRNVSMPSLKERSAAIDDRASIQHIDLRVLHSGRSVETTQAASTASLDSASRTFERKQPRQARLSTPLNLSESNKELILTLGLEEVYKRMAQNHKFHVDVVREVATRQRSLEHADQVLRNMREAAQKEYTRLLKQEPGVAVGITGAQQRGECDEEDTGYLWNEEHGRSMLSQPASPYSDPWSSQPISQAAARPIIQLLDSSPVHYPHYSPPVPTRAYEFRQLERQGRIEEARLREIRRVRQNFLLDGIEASPEVEECKMITYSSPHVEDNEDQASQTKHQIGDSRPSLACSREGLKDKAVEDDECVPQPNHSRTDRGHMGPTQQTDSSLPSSPALPNVGWTDNDDESLLDGDLVVHQELVRRKGLSSVKFRTAHLYSLLLEG